MNFSFFSSIIYMFMIPLIISSALQEGHAKKFEQYSTCLETKFQCGQDFVEMSYPFWGNNRPSYCGLEGFELTCDNEKNYLMISIDSFTFRVLSINQSDHEIWITSTGFEDDTSLCPPVLNSTFPNRTRFGSSPKSEVIYVYYDCPDGLGIELPGSLIWDDFKCMKKGVLSNGYYVAESYSEAQSQVFGQCKIQLVAPVLRKAFEEYRNNDTMSLVELLKQGFTLDYIIDEVACSACMNSSGLCGSTDADSKHFQCLCSDGAYAVSCPKHDYETYYSNCNKNFSCGERVREIGYPFWGGDRPQYCGLLGLKLSCRDDKYPVLDTGLNYTFQVVYINQTSHGINMRREDLQVDSCPSKIFDASLNSTIFDYGAETKDLHMFYNCSNDPKIAPENPTTRDNLTCTSGDLGTRNVVFFGNESFPVYHFEALKSCKVRIIVQVNKTVLEDFKKNITKKVDELLNPSFVVYYKINDVACNACKSWGGLCWSGDGVQEFTCLCHNGAYNYPCSEPGHKMGVATKVGIGLGSLALGIALTALFFCFYIRRKKAEYGSSLISRNISSYQGSISDSEKGGTCMGVPIFSYAELEKATNNFDSNREVGDGGFGSVYKGKLEDGRVVAVKRLYENNFKRVEQFMNEIEILTRLRHKNLVPLYGCTSQHCRQLLLVYEYVPNGTIADHLYGNRAKPGKLAWKTRMKIATETASALSYLHASDVIHRDVKTTNILLDNSFSVKVADFGLSRLFPLDATHVSTAPQGTPGYVDPEYHECYQLTDKSDVYSFGVVLIELISSMPAVDINRHRHEINLSNMAMNKIQNGALQELVDPNLGFESDSDVQNMIKEVAELAFQCLQNGKEFRPTMKKVYEVLLGIQSKYYGNVKVDLLGDDASLSKDNSQILSPNSVTANWVSRSTTAGSTT